MQHKNRRCQSCSANSNTKLIRWSGLKAEGTTLVPTHHIDLLCPSCAQDLQRRLTTVPKRAPTWSAVCRVLAIPTLALALYLMASVLAAQTIDKTWYWQEGTSAWREQNPPACDWHHDEDCEVG